MKGRTGVDLCGGAASCAVNEFSGALGVRGCRKHGSVVNGQHFHPGRDVGGVILAWFESKFKVGTKKSCSKFRDKLFDGVAFATEPMPAKVTVQAVLATCPMREFMG